MKGRDRGLHLVRPSATESWDRAEIAEGQAIFERALQGGQAGAYQLQAAIAAVHERGRRARRDGLG